MAAKEGRGVFSLQAPSDFSASSDPELLSSPEESPRRLLETADGCNQGALVFQDSHYDNKNTQRAMRTAVVAFRDFLIDSSLNPAFEDMPPEKLDAVLTLFFHNARKRNGELYKWSTFCSLRYGIYRHLLHLVPSVDIMHSQEFTGSQQAFNEKLKMIKEAGKGSINHMPTMTPEDTERLYRSGVFSTDNPQGLQRKVFFELLYFLLKQKRGHVLRDLMKEDVRFAVNQTGKWYAYLLKTQSDCCHGNTLEEHEKVYEIPGCPLCPIQSLLKYKSKLHPACDFLFQQPKKLPSPEDMSAATAPFADDPVWYNDKPMGKNALSQMMTAISEDAGLSQIYSNSSIRSCSEVIDGQLTLHLPFLLKKISDDGIGSDSMQVLSQGSNARLPHMTASGVSGSYSSCTVAIDLPIFAPLRNPQVSPSGSSISGTDHNSAVSPRFFTVQNASDSHSSASTSPPLLRPCFQDIICGIKSNSHVSNEISSKTYVPRGHQTSSSSSSCEPASGTSMSSLAQGSVVFNHDCKSYWSVPQENKSNRNTCSHAAASDDPFPDLQQHSRSTGVQEMAETCANAAARNRPSNYAEQLLDQLNQQRRHKKMCDVTIAVGTQTLAAHRGVLITESNYLKNMFYKGSDVREVVLPSPLAGGVRVLLDYVYSGMLELTQDNVNEVFSAANFLQMERAASLCLEFLERSCQR